MLKAFGPGAIGIRGLDLRQTIELAARTGYDSVIFDIREAARLADEQGIAGVKDLFARNGIVPGGWGLPVDWRNDQRWRDDLQDLPRLAALGRDLGATGTHTWMISGSNTRAFAENFAWHVERFRPIAEVLRDAGCRFGIEFIGPKTLRATFTYEFIYTMDGLLELARAIGTGNVGLLLDAYHLYTSHGQVSDLDHITADDVVLVHVNDAPAGIPVDEQLDQVRAVPGETGVLDLVGFLTRLDKLGYTGAVMVEPFSKRLNEKAASDPEGVAREVADSLNRLWDAAGLA